MQLTKEDIKHIAYLSRLEIKNEEIETFRGNLVSILGYVEKLSRVDTRGVAEMVIGLSTVNVWRTDAAADCSFFEHEAVIKSFTRHRGVLLEAPAVFDGRTE